MPYIRLLFAMVATLALSGCEVIRTIFDAGIWVGVIGVVVLLAVVGFVLSLFRR